MNKKVTIIAEAGVNHNGDLNLAKQLIDFAATAGADYVKFQSFKAEKIASKSAPKAAYQIHNAPDQVEQDQLSMLKKLELNEKDHQELIQYCQQKNIPFLSTPFDLDSIDLLKAMGIQLGKIPSGEITNLLYLEKMARSFEHLILSTGMATMEEIGEAVQVLMNNGRAKDQITILHCNTAYPTPMEDVNLRAMAAIQAQFGTAVGYSDHTLGIEIPIAAVALGATLIEKHFTLDNNLPGPDHKASLEPTELIAMVKAIRNVELAMQGSGEKQPSPSEEKNRAVARKSIVAAKDIRIGELFSENNITIKRPGNGISPMRWYEVLGKQAKRAFQEDELIEL